MTGTHGIHIIDTAFHRPAFDAAYLIVENGRAAFIDTGTNHSVPLLLSALQGTGVGIDAVDWVIPTHVHLDHAGGAGALMRELPNATLVVHPRGAPHLIDPTKLINAAIAVYGEEEVRRSYGDIVPVPRERVIEATDGYGVDLAGRALLCLDTPGHALHHLCVWDELSRSFFTGDTFGLSYRELDTASGAFMLPTTTPSQFDPDQLRASIQRLLTYSPQAIYLTHYGRITDIPRCAADLIAQIEAMAEIARAHAQAPDRHARMSAALATLYLERARVHGVTLPTERVLELLAMDIELNAQGLGIWLDRGR